MITITTNMVVVAETYIIKAWYVNSLMIHHWIVYTLMVNTLRVWGVLKNGEGWEDSDITQTTFPIGNPTTNVDPT